MYMSNVLGPAAAEDLQCNCKALLLGVLDQYGAIGYLI